MNSKTKRIVVALVALLVVVIATITIPKLGQDTGDKEIFVVIQDGDQVIYEESVSTDAGLLSDVLKEMQKDKEIKLEYSNSTYGMFVTGMGKSKLINNDEATGTYWTYTSDNNKQCKEANFCDAADALKVEDQDKFVFAYTAYE